MNKLLVTRYSLLVVILNFTIYNSSGQNENSCGSDWTLPEILLRRSELGIAPSGSQIYTLPVWFNVVLPESSNLNYALRAIPSQLIEGLNGYFNDSNVDIQFYQCGISLILEDDFLNLSGTETSLLRAEAQALNPDYAEVLNIYIIPGLINGFTATFSPPDQLSPGAIYLGAGGLSTASLAHEIGHYFGLAHTFAYGPLVTDPSNPQFAQYVDDEVELLVNGVLTTFTCDVTGDGICDTPADPYRSNINSGCNFSDCTTLLGCSPYPNDPLGKKYNPDPTLLMSYYNECRYRFSTDQADEMVRTLTQHSNWNFLIDGNLPECQVFSTSDYGWVLQNCENIDLEFPTRPVSNLDFPLVDATNSPCGSTTPRTNPAGQYPTFLCVNPYSGTGELNILPNLNHSSPLNGVTTFDLLQMSKHILGIEPFVSPFQSIAADANNSASVTTTDIVELRKLILGIYSELPNNNNWRYVPELCLKDPVFASNFFDPNQAFINPFNATWTNPIDQINRTYGAGAINDVPNAVSWTDFIALDPNDPVAEDPDAWSFWAVKVGDVNCTAELTMSQQEEPSDEFVATTALPTINTNQVFTIQIKSLSNEPVSAWQVGLEFSDQSIEFLNVLQGNSGEPFSLDNFGLTEVADGKIRALNFSETGGSININSKTLFQLEMRAKTSIPNLMEEFLMNNSVLPKKFYDQNGMQIENYQLGLSVSLNSLSLPHSGDIGNHTEISNSALAYPSPFESELQFEIFLDQDEKVIFTLFDSFGRIVKQVTQPSIKGLNIVRIDGLSQAPSGTYYYTLSTDSQSFTGKAMKD